MKSNKILENIKSFKDFFITNVLKKFIIVLGIIILICIILTVSYTSKQINVVKDDINKEQIQEEKTEGTTGIDNTKTTNNGIVKYVVENLLTLVILILAGFIPYIFLGVIGIFMISSNTVAIILSTIYYPVFNNGQLLTLGNTVLIYVVLIINVLIYALVIATSIYMCKISIKKFKYTNQYSFGFKDMVININNMIGRNKQADKMKKEKQAKTEKYKNQVVVLDIKNVVILTVIVSLINVVTSVIMYNI